METQEISAPANGLTTETPKRRQVGYGLPCAKCHKYFPADLEVCPICKGRERVSPVVAVRIPKPVKSETSVAPSSSNIALKQEVKESPESESPAFAPPVEIKVKNQPLDQKESITIPVAAEIAAVERARASLVLTQPVFTEPLLTEKEKESPNSESLAFAAPEEVHAVDVHAEDQLLNEKESITIPALTEAQGAIESARDNAITAKDATFIRETESPTVAASVASFIEYPCLDPLQQPIVILASAEAEPRIVPVAESMTSVRAEQSPEEQEAPAFSVSEHAAVEDPCLTGQDNNNNDQPNQEEPTAIPALVEAEACDLLPTAMAPMREEEELATELEAPAAAVSMQADVVDQYLDEITQALQIVIPMLLEARASDPVPTAVAPEHTVGELPNELESQAIEFPKQIAVEEQRPDRTRHADPIVIPMLIEAQASEPAPVVAELAMLEQEKKAEASEILQTPMSASAVQTVEEKIVEVAISEVEIAEVTTVESPAVFEQPNRAPDEEKSKVVDNGSDAAPKPAAVNSPVVVNINLGELRAAKGTSERAPTPEHIKGIISTESAASQKDTSSDTCASESPAPVSGRTFDLVTFVLGVVVLACAILLITLVALRLMPRHASEPVRRAKATYSSALPTADQNTNASIPTPPLPAAASENSASSDSSPVEATTAAPAQPPAASASNLSSSPGPERVLVLSPGLAEGNLLYRVEPDYPEEARRQGMQGPVVLDLHLSKDGLVQGVDLVSGQPLLAQAATTAVRQWRFRTRYVNGYEVEMQARITLHFALPTP